MTTTPVRPNYKNKQNRMSARKRRRKKRLRRSIFILLLINLTIFGIVNLPKAYKKSAKPSAKDASVESVQDTISKEESSARRKFLVCLDPGHGYDDGGCGSKYLGDLNEKDINLSISLKIRSLLENYGFSVIMTRDSDKIPDSIASNLVGMYTFSCSERIAISNNANADLFLSVHCNYFKDPEINGPRLYYCIGNTTTTHIYAQLLANGIKDVLGLDSIITADSIDDSYQVCREVNAPSVLTEVGFVTNPEDAAMLIDDAWQQKYAQSIAKGIINYYIENNSDPTSASRQSH